jgi:hypothetical protein
MDRKMVSPLFALVFLACLAFPWAAPAEEGEAALKKELAAAFASGDKDKKAAALDKLSGTASKAMCQALYAIAVTDTEEASVRLKALEILTGAACPDTSAAQLAAQAFAETRPKDEANKQLKVDFAQALSKLEFKYHALDAMQFYARGLSWPADLDPKYKNAKSEELVQKQRAHVKAIHEAFNALAGTSFTSDRKAPSEIVKWWNQNQIEIQKKDMELIKKKKEEAGKTGK